jgi:hypothetical protein
VKRADFEQQTTVDDRIRLGTTPSAENTTDHPTGESNEANANANASAEATTTASDSPALTGITLKQPSEEMGSGKEAEGRRNFLDLTGLIRSIQRAEGNIDCFRVKNDCSQLDCCWRSYCLDGSSPPGQSF